VLLYWTSANRVVSFRLLAVTMTFMLVGDIGYAYIGTQGHIVGSPLLDLPFERVIVSHGEPVHDRAAYERALELPPWSGP